MHICNVYVLRFYFTLKKPQFGELKDIIELLPISTLTPRVSGRDYRDSLHKGVAIGRENNGYRLLNLRNRNT